MSENGAEADGEVQQVVVVGPDGQPVGTIPAHLVEGFQEGADGPDAEDDEERHLTDLVEQPAKVMRIGSMIRQLLEEVKSAPLDEASRHRLKEIHRASVKELETGLAPELVEERQRPAGFTEVLRAARQVLDPAGILNPGALITG